MGLPKDHGKADAAAASLAYQTWFHRISFLLTGIFTTIVNQIIFYNGIGDPSTGFLSLPTYLGMLAVVVMPIARTPSAVPQYRIMGSATIDVSAHVLCMLGLQVVGSGVYQVLYSSGNIPSRCDCSCCALLLASSLPIPCAVVCFTALFSTCILRKSHSALQWMGILAIAFGLALTSHDSVPDHPEHGTTFMAGILVTLLGCICYAGSYVTNEGILSKGAAIVPQRLCVLVGLYGSSLHLAYMSATVLPNWQVKVVDKIASSGTPVYYCVVLYGALVMSSFLHNMAYFHLLRHTGAVSTGVLTALRAVGVFFASGFFFCEIHTAQCLTAYKCAAALAVASGTLIYSFGSAKAAPSTPNARPMSSIPKPFAGACAEQSCGGDGVAAGGEGAVSVDASMYLSQTSHGSTSSLKGLALTASSDSDTGLPGTPLKRGTSSGAGGLLASAAAAVSAVTGAAVGKKQADWVARKKRDDDDSHQEVSLELGEDCADPPRGPNVASHSQSPLWP